jgi:GPI mannosyltransferase 1 subunit M
MDELSCWGPPSWCAWPSSPSETGRYVKRGSRRLCPVACQVGAWRSWQDANFRLKYTDIDYLVFSDAAELMRVGASPYLRDTYRYTPLLALALVPNRFYQPWGKLLFASVDILVGLLIGRIAAVAYPSWPRRVLLEAAWLLNPISINISTRGSADSIVGCLVLLTTLLVLEGRAAIAGVVHGVAVHVKLYPVIFSLSYLMSLGAIDRKCESGR